MWYYWYNDGFRYIKASKKFTIAVLFGKILYYSIMYSFDCDENIKACNEIYNY